MAPRRTRARKAPTNGALIDMVQEIRAVHNLRHKISGVYGEDTGVGQEIR